MGGLKLKSHMKLISSTDFIILMIVINIQCIYHSLKVPRYPTLIYINIKHSMALKKNGGDQMT